MAIAEEREFDTPSWGHAESVGLVEAAVRDVGDRREP